jgi:N-methylhydantoinase B
LQHGSFPAAMEAVLARFAGDMQEGDVFALNDPFEGGTHLPDIFLIKPVFIGGELAYFVLEVGHHIDIGGRTPGGNAADSREIYEEGLRLPPLKLVQQGVPNESVFRIIEANVRVPWMVFGDLRAKLAALDTGERGLRQLVVRYGLDRLTAYAHQLMSYSERLTRQEISALPDGRYEFEDFLDDDGVGGEPVRIHVAITIHEEEIDVDFDGTAAQVPGALNSTLSMTRSATLQAIRGVLRGNIPNNAGFFRPIRIEAAEGSVLNALPPAASGARGLTLFRVADVVLGALAQAVPDRVPAAGEGGSTLYAFASLNAAGEHSVVVEIFSGAWGGRPDRDGIGGITNPLLNQQNIPIEQLEAEYPLRVEEYGFVTGSAGAGRYRGGPAMVRHLTYLGGTGVLQIRSDRRKFRPYGLFGGHAGTSSENTLIRKGKETLLPSKVTAELLYGDAIRFVMAGAGGYGPPLSRLADAVLDDYLDDIITADEATATYGVVIDEASDAIDAGATAERRSGTMMNGAPLPRAAKQDE